MDSLSNEPVRHSPPRLYFNPVSHKKKPAIQQSKTWRNAANQGSHACASASPGHGATNASSNRLGKLAASHSAELGVRLDVVLPAVVVLQVLRAPIRIRLRTISIQISPHLLEVWCGLTIKLLNVGRTSCQEAPCKGNCTSISFLLLV